MSESLRLLLRQPVERLAQQWTTLRQRMTRERPDPFTRNEWAALIASLEPAALQRAFDEHFPRVEGPLRGFVKPRGRVAVWLPNNVGLLGPMVFNWLWASGNEARFKTGSKSDDLTAVWARFVEKHVSDPWLARLEVAQFGREDHRNAEMAAWADVRLVFGGDLAARAVDALPHPVTSLGIAFAHRVSEIWVEPAEVTDEVVQHVVRMTSLYGQAACTAPRRVVVLGDILETEHVARRVLEQWPAHAMRAPFAHEVSRAVVSLQVAQAIGWNASLTADRMLAVGWSPAGAEPLPVLDAFLPFVSAEFAQAKQSAPENLQTIGLVSSTLSGEQVAQETLAKRVVPIAAMHTFGPWWDGVPWWSLVFEVVSVR